MRGSMRGSVRGSMGLPPQGQARDIIGRPQDLRGLRGLDPSLACVCARLCVCIGILSPQSPQNIE